MLSQILSVRLILYLAYAPLILAITSKWSFLDGKSIVAKKGDGDGVTSSFIPGRMLASPLAIDDKDILKLSFTLIKDNKPAKPHQIFLLVKDASSDLETFFTFSVKESTGKAKVDISHKHLPPQLLNVPELDLFVVIGAFEAAPGVIIPIGKITPVIDPATKEFLQKQIQDDVDEEAEAYKPRKEIRHIFRVDPKSPSKIITLVFLLAVIGGYAGLVGTWITVLGANVNHLPKAIQSEPLSHPLFFMSLLIIEGLFFLYYVSFNLFQILTGTGIVGLVAFLSGSRALREVRGRRERNER